MKKVITYGTFDLLHEGHINLLNRAKSLGDYLIVGVTTDVYDESRGKLNVQEDLMTRIENVRNTGIADEIIIEEYEGQKINDIQKYDIKIFAIGSDWIGKFDYLREYCNVIYLERTKGISSTSLRKQRHGILKLGIVGYGRIANRFVPESKYVSGVNIEGVFGRSVDKAKKFAKQHELGFYTTNYEELLRKVNAVYIATPHLSHYDYVKQALKNNIHVLCEKPLVLSSKEAEELYELAAERELVLLEAIKTAFSPGFLRIIAYAKSGMIGEIKKVSATFTKLITENREVRELEKKQAGGSVNELASYPLLAMIKLLGSKSIENIQYVSHYDDKRQVDLFTNIHIYTNQAFGSATVGLGVKSEGSLVISGSQGYIYVDAPWWKAGSFEVRFENPKENKKYYYEFQGDGLRYELAEFLRMINSKEYQSYKFLPEDSIMIAKIIEGFHERNDIKRIY